VHRFHRFHTISNHFYISRPIFLHRDAFDAWPADLQAAMRAAVTDAVAFQRGLAVEEDGEARRAIEAQGCEIVALSPDEHRAFAAAVQPLRAEVTTSYGREMFGMVGGGM
jgi:TRAP-type C4-dicarboxylate transport system substrate-binding protein